MTSRARAIGGALALGRADLGVQGDHDLVERETRTRIVQRVLDLGCEPSVVSCGLMAGSHQFGLAGVAGVHVVHDGGQFLATVPSHSRWKHHAHLTDPAQRPCPAGARFSKNVGSDRQSPKTATELVALRFDASAREAARPTTAVALTSLARERAEDATATLRHLGATVASRLTASRLNERLYSLCQLRQAPSPANHQFRARREPGRPFPRSARTGGDELELTRLASPCPGPLTGAAGQPVNGTRSTNESGSMKV